MSDGGLAFLEHMLNASHIAIAICLPTILTGLHFVDGYVLDSETSEADESYFTAPFQLPLMLWAYRV